MDHITLFKREHHQSSEFESDIFSETFKNLSDSNISAEAIEENISTLFSMHDDRDFLCEMEKPKDKKVDPLDRFNILVGVVNNKDVNPIQRIQSALIIQNYLCDPDVTEFEQTFLEGAITSFMGLTKDLYDPTQEDLGLIPVGLQILSDTFKNGDFAGTLYNEEYQEKVINIGINGIIEFISSGVKDNARNDVLEAFVFTLSDIVNDDKFEEKLDEEYALQLKQKAMETFNQVENYHLQ